MITIKREKVQLTKIGKEVFLNPISIQDDEWLSEHYTQDELTQAFTKVDVEILFSIFWRLLDNDAKRMISKAEVVEWDGLVEKKIEVTDPVKKLKMIVAGAKEIMEIMTAILNTRKNSMPDVVVNEKKNLMEAQSSQIQKSSTSSQANTEPTSNNLGNSQGDSLVI
jgi:hypothetical protein